MGVLRQTSIFWAVPTRPVRAQEEALRRHFGDYRLEHFHHPSPEQVLVRFRNSGCSELVYVGSLDRVSWLIREGVQPLWVETEEVETGDTADIVLQDQRRFRFLGFRRVTRVALDLRVAYRQPSFRRLLNLTGRPLNDETLQILRGLYHPDLEIANPNGACSLRDAGDVISRAGRERIHRVLMNDRLWGILQGLGNNRFPVTMVRPALSGERVRVQDCFGVIFEASPL